MITSIGDHANYTLRGETNYIVLHHAATKTRQKFDVFDAHMSHIGRGFSGLGYHIYIEKTGAVRTGRPLNTVGAHCNSKGSNGESINFQSIGICLELGIDSDGKPVDNFKDEQYKSLQGVLSMLSIIYPDAELIRHKDVANTLCNEIDIDRLTEVIR